MSVEIPGYKIIRAIGRGGMATVYLAEQEIFEREVALKIMSTRLTEDPSFGQRFFREAKIVSRLVHPNIVTVHDVGEHDGHFYLSMEHIDGGDLKLARKRLTFRQKINAVKDIAKALQYAATKGYVHRDIKPENIMFHLADGRAVLTDFGIARAAEADMSVTQTGVAIGTPHYMSPEQAKGLPVDGRADIYGLGVVLYLMLTGKVPYDAESAVAIGIKHITDPIPLLPTALNELQPVIDKLMAKSPEQRYQTAASVISALDNLDMPHLEKLALELDKEQRENSASDPESETPTIVSRPTAIAPSASSAEVAEAPEKTSAKASDAPNRPTRKTIPKSRTEPNIDVTQMSEAIDEEEQRFTVIYETELGSLDKETSWIGAWLYGLMIVGVMLGAIYFYLNPKDWDDLLARSKAFYEENVGSAQGDASTPVAEVAPAQPSIEEQATQADSASKVVESKGSDDAGSADTDTLPSEQNESAFNESQVQVASETQPEGALDEETLSEFDAATEASVDSPTGPTEEERHEAAVLAARERISSLEDAFVNDAAFLPDLVAAYRDLLRLEPDDEQGNSKIRSLHASEMSKVQVYFQEEKFSAARKKLTQLEALFPETDADHLRELNAQIDKQEHINQLLSKADALFAAGSITEPESDNALVYFKRVYEVDEKNAQAQAGVRKVSNHYLNIATAAFARGDISEAENQVKLALTIDWKNAKAEALLEDIRILQEKLAKRDLLFLQAEQALNSGDYFEPVKENAYHFYALILEENPEDDRARQGVEMTIEGFSAWVWSLVGDNKFTEAKSAFVSPLNILPHESRLQTLAVSVDAVIEERLAADRALVSKVLVSGNEISDLSAAQAQSFKAGRSLYVMFSYENLPLDVTSIQAKLLDGAGNIEIAQANVELSGGNGSATFTIDSPVGRFPIGLYTLVMSQGGKVLSSTVFTVE